MLLNKEQLFSQLEKPMSSSALISIDKFIAWRDSKTFDDFTQIEHRGILNRKDIASQIQEEQRTTFPKSHLNDNKWVKALLTNLEDYLRNNNVLPQLTTDAKEENKKGAEDNPRTHNSNKRKEIQNSKRVTELEELVLQQKERIRQLEQKNAAHATKANIYAELATMGAEFGN